jgi:hypothetical protein
MPATLAHRRLTMLRRQQIQRRAGILNQEATMPASIEHRRQVLAHQEAQQRRPVPPLVWLADGDYHVAMIDREHVAGVMRVTTPRGDVFSARVVSPSGREGIGHAPTLEGAQAIAERDPKVMKLRRAA